MPIYELYCEACGHEFEQIVAFSATSLPACPACQSEQVGRRMSRPAIHFKGSGWYITDSRKGNGKQSNNGGDSSASKSENKPAATEGAGEKATGGEAKTAESTPAKSVEKAPQSAD